MLTAKHALVITFLNQKCKRKKQKYGLDYLILLDYKENCDKMQNTAIIHSWLIDY